MKFGIKFLDPKNHPFIDSKYIYRIKKDETDEVAETNFKLVAQHFYKEKYINHKETFASVDKLKAVAMLLSFVCLKDFKLFKMLVSELLDGCIKE